MSGVKGQGYEGGKRHKTDVKDAGTSKDPAERTTNLPKTT